MMTSPIALVCSNGKSGGDHLVEAIGQLAFLQQHEAAITITSPETPRISSNGSIALRHS